MSARASLEKRIKKLDWSTLYDALDATGYAITRPLLTPRECKALARLYDDDRLFRKTINLARFRFGENGAYRYFAEPIPEPVATLREAFYSPLAELANHWAERLGVEERYPHTLREYRRVCQARGQVHPTPLLLHYESGGYNCLHQDVYGELAFPLQVTGMLSCVGKDFSGGEFLLVEQRPRMQSRGEAIVLEQGQFVVFPNQQRPVKGSRGHYRVKVRHGVSRIRFGQRRTLGIIFHDAR